MQRGCKQTQEAKDKISKAATERWHLFKNLVKEDAERKLATNTV